MSLGFTALRSSLAASAPDTSTAPETDPRTQLLRYQVEEIILPATAGLILAIPLSLDGTPCTLHLEPHSIRADGFRVLVQDDFGQIREEAASPTFRTYRGDVDGLTGARVAASVAEGQLEAVILLDDGSRWYVEPLVEPDGSRSQRNAHLVYQGNDVVAQSHQCGAGDDAEWPSSRAVADGAVVAQAGPTKICDIAFDADVEFFIANGGSVSRTVDDIETILNGVSLLYENELNITYELTTVVVRTSETDPYSSTDPSALLNQFRNEWNAQMVDVHRDIAHLMTGKNLTNPIIGTSYTNVMCDTCAGGYGYGLSQSRFSGLMSNRVCLTAHEIGHNWGATHCDANADCGVMCSMLGGCAGTCTHFGQSSLAIIDATASSAVCLATVGPPLQFPFCETFDFGLSNATWSYNAASSPAATASNPPSPPNALRIDNCCTECSNAPDDIRTNFIPMAGVSQASLLYYTQQAGSFSTQGSQLVIDYWSNDQSWVELNRITSNGLAQTTFTPWVHQLPADALHDEARIRFRLEAVSSADVWYVDNVAVVPGLPESNVLFVRRDALEGGGGTSWNDAYVNLQDALVVVACAAGAAEEIWVSSGTYKPDRGTGDRSSSFRLLNGVSLLGGFGGTENEARERRPEMNPTVLSGDIGLAGIISDDAYHVVTGSATDVTAVLDGFTISGGRAVSVANDGGGGLRVVSGSPTISSCVFSANTGNNGGGVFVGTNSLPQFTDCTFFENQAFLSGGGLYVAAGGRPNLNRCRFLDNFAMAFGGGIHNSNSRADLRNTTLAGNTASSGGGIYNQLGTLTLQNTTLSANAAALSTGGIINANGIVTVRSSILWGNRDSGGKVQSSQIAGALPVVNYSCIQGWTGSLGGVGNIGLDPLFVDADGVDDIPGTFDDELQLTPASPAIDSGDLAADAASLGLVDLDENPRILCGRVDMGAFEFGVGDFGCDRTVNLLDFAQWSTCMTGPAGASIPPSCAAFDFNVDSHVDLRDFAGFQRVFSDP